MRKVPHGGVLGRRGAQAASTRPPRHGRTHASHHHRRADIPRPPARAAPRHRRARRHGVNLAKLNRTLGFSSSTKLKKSTFVNACLKRDIETLDLGSFGAGDSDDDLDLDDLLASTRPKERLNILSQTGGYPFLIWLASTHTHTYLLCAHTPRVHGAGVPMPVSVRGACGANVDGLTAAHDIKRPSLPAGLPPCLPP